MYQEKLHNGPDNESWKISQTCDLTIFSDDSHINLDVYPSGVKVFCGD